MDSVWRKGVRLVQTRKCKEEDEGKKKVAERWPGNVRLPMVIEVRKDVGNS